MTLLEIIDEAKETTRRLFDGTDYLDNLCAIIDKAVRLTANHDTDRSNIRQLGGGWVAEETLAIAIYCALRYEHDFSAGIIAAVNHDVTATPPAQSPATFLARSTAMIPSRRSGRLVLN